MTTSTILWMAWRRFRGKHQVSDWGNVCVCRSHVRPRQSGVVPWLWKLDVDSAYRRLPLACCDQWAAWIAFRYMTQIFVSMHLACPFGATASVQAWQRIAAAVTFLARTVLGLSVFCYVDDYIGVDRSCRFVLRPSVQCRQVCLFV